MSGAYDCLMCGKPTDEMGPARCCKKCAKAIATIPKNFPEGDLDGDA